MGKIIGYHSRNWTRGCKNCFENAVYKTADATWELIKNKIGDKIVKPKLVFDENSINIEGILIRPEKTREIKNELIGQLKRNGAPQNI